jgi:hypothetical protein
VEITFTIAPPRPCPDHQAGHRLRTQKCAVEDHGELRRPLAERHVEDALLVEDRRVVHQHVDGAELICDARREGDDRRFVRDVRGHRERFAAELADAGGAVLGVALVAVDAGDPRAFGGERLGDSAADVRARPGHDRDAAYEIHAAASAERASESSSTAFPPRIAASLAESSPSARTSAAGSRGPSGSG